MWFTSKFLGNTSNTGTTRAAALVFALVAQQVAHFLGKGEVAGSNPAVSIFIYYIEREGFSCHNDRDKRTTIIHSFAGLRVRNIQ